MKSKLDQFFRPKKADGDKPPSKKVGYLVILGLTGIFLIIISNIFSTEEKEPNINIQPQGEAEDSEQVAKTSASSTDVSEEEERIGQELASMLNKIQSVTEAEVMVNLDATSEQIYEKNTSKGQQITDESDRNGGTRKIEDNTEDKQVVTIRKGEQEMPLLVQTKQPEVRGVFVVANGADQPSVKNQIIEAVSRVLDVPTHKISVMPKN